MKRKKFILLINLLIITFLMQSSRTFAQYDSAAIMILDRMSNMFGSIESISFKMNIEYDKLSDKAGLIKHSEEAIAYMRGPNKMLVQVNGDNGKKDYLYNGKTFTYYSILSNQYATIDAPATNIETIDLVHNDYGLDFPASDFFYPNFVNDLLANSKNLLYLGITKINDKECFHLAGLTTDNSMTYQFWIADDAYFFPVKMVIVYTDKSGNPQYEGVISDWEVNPALPDAMFEFKVPPGSKKINFKKINK
jgi:hypothetical protein